MIRFSILASGSKGNCCVIQSQHTTILIDCGYKIRYLKKCFEEIQVNQFDVMLVTHEHSDHIAQMKHFAHLPTISATNLDLHDLTIAKPFESYYVKDIKITILPLSHDAKNTIGFLFETNKESLVYICDTGYVSSKVQKYIQNKMYYIFESNHDIQMLMSSNRSMFLKQRIAGDTGHLNNVDCATTLKNVVGENTKQVFLAHLSEDCNTEELALQTALQLLPKHIDIRLAKQHCMVKGGNHD